MQLSSPHTILEKAPIILIVDDLIDNIQVLALFLETHGYSVSYALNAQEALQRLKAIQVDLILLDLFMPEINGLDLCEQIKSNPHYQDIPIIFLTASHDEQHIISAFEHGAADYVMKPFKTQEVIARISLHIQLRRQAIALRQTQEKLATIANQMQDGLVVIDQDGMIQFVNSMATTMLHQSSMDLLGYPFANAMIEGQLTQLDIVRLDGTPGMAEVSITQERWADQPAFVIRLRDVGDNYGGG